MTTFKGENSTISLKAEDTWGALADYTGAKVFQNNDGSFNAERGTLESEARTPNAELAGQRLGNTNVSGSFPVEIDPYNYNHLFESLFYGAFAKSGSTVALTAATIEATTKYQVVVDVASGDQTTLGATVGDAYLLKPIVDVGYSHLEGVVVLLSKTSTQLTFFTPLQDVATIASASSDVTIECVDTLRPGKSRKSFNAEETLHGEDGTSTARFMTVGAIVSGTELNIPSDANLKATFSFIGSGKRASAKYEDYDANLTNSAAAHTATVSHVKYDPMVLQDGAIISGGSDTRCQWLSGTVSIENGTETYFTGCSFNASGANSGNLRIKLNYEALFESEQDYITFEAENTSDVMLQLKVRNTDECIVIYLPAFKATGYTLNSSTGLVTASITGSAEVSPTAINSAIIASYNLQA